MELYKQLKVLLFFSLSGIIMVFPLKKNLQKNIYIYGKSEPLWKKGQFSWPPTLRSQGTTWAACVWGTWNAFMALTLGS
jgi:hypothetical protein